MFDKLEEKLNDLFPSFDKFGNKRGPLENYVVGTSVHIISLVINALLLTGLLVFNKPDTAHTIAIAIVVSSTMIILCSWEDAITNIKSHRKKRTIIERIWTKLKNTSEYTSDTLLKH